MGLIIYLIFIFLSFGQLGRISFFEQVINIYLYEMIMGIGLIVLFFLSGFKRLLIELYKKKAILFFLGVLLISLINNFWNFSLKENFIGFLYWFRLFFYFIFFIALSIQKNTRIILAIKRGFYFFIYLTIFFSFIQYFLYPDLRNLYYLGWDPHQYRVFGSFFDTTISGIIFMILFFYFLNERKYKQSIINRLILFLLFILLILTYSRITYLSIICGLIFYFYNRRIIFIIFFLFFSIILLPRFPGESTNLARYFTIEARINNYREGIEYWLKRPFLGWGYNRIRFLRSVDNINHAGANFSSSFLTIAVSSGVVGLFAFIKLLYIFFSSNDRLVKTITFAVGFASLLDNVFLVNFVLFLFLMICFSRPIRLSDN